MSKPWISSISRIQKVRYHMMLLRIKPAFTSNSELGVSAMTSVWVRKEVELNLAVPNGASSWISSGIRIAEEQ